MTLSAQDRSQNLGHDNSNLGAEVKQQIALPLFGIAPLDGGRPVNDKPRVNADVTVPGERAVAEEANNDAFRLAAATGDPQAGQITRTYGAT